MEIVNTILSALASSFSVVGGALSIGQWLKSHLRKTYQDSKAKDVLTFLQKLGCVNEDDIRKLVEGYKFPKPLERKYRDELIMLLTNLSRGARFHSTHGTALSSYLRCERLLEQLLANIQPRRNTGEPVGPGWMEWKLERFLGMGAFGEVWLGKSKLHPDPRAFKFFTLTGAKEWLRKEQEVLFRVKDRLRNHPNIIDFDNVVIEKEDWPFLVLEYVGGGSLEDWILAHPEDRKSLNPQAFMEGVARGLAKAHSAEVAHRDLKPANILLTTGKVIIPKITDFGLSKIEENQTATGSVLVSQAVVVGTQMYLPPEASSPIEPRSPAQDDVFAFGVIWYQLLVNRLERPSYDFVKQLETAGVDSRTLRLLSRCLAHPDRRFKDGEELRTALEDESASPEWDVPAGCFDVGYLASEYLNTFTN